ncbi:hypothetical protein ACM0JF_02420 [Mycoplasma sp. 654]|uniref:hypothetical protein n=1 Tax=Mycoplasma sp. 654 TaxID=3398773 RepID=UPI003A8788D0
MKFKKWFMFPLIGMSVVTPIATMSATTANEKAKIEKLIIVPETEVIVKNFKPLYIEQYLNILDFYIDSLKENIRQAYGDEKIEKSRWTNKTEIYYTNYKENIKNTVFAKTYDEQNDYFDIKNKISDLLKTDINDKLVKLLINPNELKEYFKNTRTSKINDFNTRFDITRNTKFDYAKYQYAKTVNLLMAKEFNTDNKETVKALWNSMDEIVKELIKFSPNIRKQKEDFERKFKSNQTFEDMFYNKKNRIKEFRINEYIKNIDTENVFAYKKSNYNFKTNYENKLEAEEKINISKKYLTYDEFKSLFYISSGNPYNSKIQEFNNYNELTNAIKNDSNFSGLSNAYIEDVEIPSHLVVMEKYNKMLKTQYKLLKLWLSDEKNYDILDIINFNNSSTQWLKNLISIKLNDLYTEEIYTDDAFNKYMDANFYFYWVQTGDVSRNVEGKSIDYQTFIENIKENKNAINEMREIFDTVSMHWFPLHSFGTYALGYAGVPLDFIINNLNDNETLKEIKYIIENSNNDTDTKEVYFDTYIQKLKAIKSSFSISPEIANKQIEKLHNIENEIVSELNLNNKNNSEKLLILKSFLSSMVRNYENFLKEISKTDDKSKLELKLEEINTIKQSAFILKELANKVIDYMTTTKQIDLSQQKEKLNSLDLETDNINDLVNNYHEALLLLSKLPFTEEDKDTVFSEKFDKNFNKIQNRPEMITLLNALPKNTKPQIVIKDGEITPQEDNKGLNPIFAGLISATVACGIAALIGLGLLIKRKK